MAKNGRRTYNAFFTTAAFNDLRAVKDKRRRAAIDAKIRSFSKNPRPAGSKKLVGGSSEYRVRVGDYRIIYEVDDSSGKILVTRIRDRKDVYKGGG